MDTFAHASVHGQRDPVFNLTLAILFIATENYQYSDIEMHNFAGRSAKNKQNDNFFSFLSGSFSSR